MSIIISDKDVINKINNNNKKQKNEKRSSKILQRGKRFRVY